MKAKLRARVRVLVRIASPHIQSSHVCGRPHPSVTLRVRLLEERHDVRLVRLDRVRQAASVLQGVVGERGKVIRLHPELRQVFRYADVLRELLDGRDDKGDGALLACARILRPAVKAHGLCDVQEELWAILRVAVCVEALAKE